MKKVIMTNATLVHFIFKPDKKQAWLDWSCELLRRREEVIETLKEEGVLSESCFISEDGESIFYFMEAEDIEKVHRVFADSIHDIDLDHKKVMGESLVRISQLKCLFHIDNRI